ncbi:UNVERIFIED_CONTAM: hypothetical protein NCL1_05707 [Trichonephila clavipes]
MACTLNRAMTRRATQAHDRPRCRHAASAGHCPQRTGRPQGPACHHSRCPPPDQHGRCHDHRQRHLHPPRQGPGRRGPGEGQGRRFPPGRRRRRTRRRVGADRPGRRHRACHAASHPRLLRPGTPVDRAGCRHAGRRLALTPASGPRREDPPAGRRHPHARLGDQRLRRLRQAPHR